MNKNRENAIQYFIYPNSGVVVAKLSNLKEENINLVEKLTGISSWADWSFEEYRKTIDLFKDSYTGISKCAEGDKFDEVFGMELAKNRLLTKVNQMRANLVMRVYKKMDEKLDDMERYIHYYTSHSTEYANREADMLNN